MNPLHQRTTSGFPLSIATGMAMETLFAPRQVVFDPVRVPPPRIVISQYQEIWINVLTLIRNAYNACDQRLIKDIDPNDVVEIITQEMELITDLLKNEGKGFTKAFFYFNEYGRLFKKDDKVFKRREDRTELQKHARSVYEKTKFILSRYNKDIVNFNLDIKSSGGDNSLIFTHIPADLLSYRNFGNINLLESHTGKLKTRLEWNTKFHSCGESDMGRLPFCRQLLSIFGDNTLITPIPLKARREVLEVANQSRWTPATSPNKVSGDLSAFLKDILLASVIRSIPIF